MDPTFNRLYGTNCSTPYFGPYTVEDNGWADSSNQVYDEITNQITINHWSTTNAIFFLFTPSNFEVASPSQSCAKATCGYHNNIGSVVYAVVASDPKDCPTIDGSVLDTVVNITSHEQFEAISDPTWTWVDPSGNDGWYASDTCVNSNGIASPCDLEIGDKCADIFENIYLNGHTYNGVQGEYSNATHDCVYPNGPTEKPVAVGRNANGTLEIFKRGSDGAIWHDFQCTLSSCTAGWSGWSWLGESLSSAPAVGQNSDGRLEVFAVGSGGDLEHVVQCGSFCSNPWSN